MTAASGSIPAVPPGMAGPTGVHSTRVAWVDTDAAGIYHNTTVVRYVECAEAALARDRGLAGYFPVAPRIRYEVTFEAPLRFEEEVTAYVTLTALGRTSMTFGFEVWGEARDDRPRFRAAHGTYVTVHVAGTRADGSTRSTPWPADWVAALTDDLPRDAGAVGQDAGDERA